MPPKHLAGWSLTSTGLTMLPNIVGVQYSQCPAHEPHLHVEILCTDDAAGAPTTTGSYAIVAVQEFGTEVIEVDAEASGLATDALRFQLIAADVQQVMGSMTPASREAMEKVAEAAGVTLAGSFGDAPDAPAADTDEDDEDALPGQYL